MSIYYYELNQSGTCTCSVTVDPNELWEAHSAKAAGTDMSESMNMLTLHFLMNYDLWLHFTTILYLET